MKKHEKGFTLVELLAVIVILAIVLIIAVPGVLSIINSTKQKGYESQLKMIKEAARNYLTSESSSIVWKDGKATITLKLLQDNGYLDKKIIDPRNKKEITCANVLVTKDSKNKVIYQVDDDACKPTPEACFTFDKATKTITAYDKTCEKDVRIPSKIDGTSVVTIAPFSFGLNELTSVVIPDSVTTIGMMAFDSNRLTSVTIGKSVETIGEQAFAHSQLTSVVIPDSVTTIGIAAFIQSQLTSVTIGKNVTEIGASAFRHNKLTSVVIPNSVTEIGADAFSRNQLTSLVLSEGVRTIGNDAFSGNQIKNLSLPKSLITIGPKAFNGNLLPDDQAFIYARNADGTEDKTKIVSYAGANYGTVAIPDNVITIGEKCFQYCEFDNLIIPDSVTTIKLFALQLNKKVTIKGKSSINEFIDGASAGWREIAELIFEP